MNPFVPVYGTSHLISWKHTLIPDVACDWLPSLVAKCAETDVETTRTMIFTNTAASCKVNCISQPAIWPAQDCFELVEVEEVCIILALAALRLVRFREFLHYIRLPIKPCQFDPLKWYHALM